MRLLNSTEVGEILSISSEAVQQRRKRGELKADYQTGPGGAGTVYGYLPERFGEEEAAPADDPALLGDDPGVLPDETWIGPKMWAALRGVQPQTVYRNNMDASRHRAEGEPRDGDMPPPDGIFGQAIRWRLGTYRAWETGHR